MIICEIQVFEFKNIAAQGTASYSLAAIEGSYLP